MVRARILGIDPGLTGAIALLTPDVPGVVSVWDMPTVLKTVGMSHTLR